ncbi:MAG: DEAD/DEAH box helicase, partial [Candidatus Pacebacteria bacterium]|nr:DEAD/DEAH box helicase [Candidatus Paceibacterota bacterium]
MNYLEKAFIQDVFYPDYGDKGLDLIIPQHKIYNESTGENYSYDFLLTTKKAKYLIETDGLYSHIQGKVSKEYFNKLQRKSNEMNLYGIPIRLVSESILKSPKEGRYDLRRQLIADDEMVKLRRGQSENIQPHEIQQEALDALNESRIRGNKRGLVSIATGVGKTYLSAFDVKQMKSESILFVVHITEVIRQSRISFEDVLYDRIDEMGSYFGGKKEISKNIIFASIQSLNKKSNLINFQRDQFDYVIIDETHHVAAPSYSKIFDYFTPKFFLGLTATPDRMDKKDILPYFNNNLVYEIDQKTAIEKGELVPYKYIGFKDDIDYSDIQWNGYKYNVEDLNKALLIDKRDKQILEKYNEYCNGKKTIGFCVSIEHAEWMANTFNKNGIKSVAIHSAVKDEDGSSELKGSEKSIKDFREGRYQVAFVVNMFNEGIDIIDTECLLFLRPTESRSIFTQQMGRGLRISPNKENVIILDFIGNYETATFITGGLGLSSFGKLEQCEGANGEKLLYHFDNNGSEVFFEEEVVQLLKELKSKESKEVDNDLIDEEWLDYSKFVKQSSVDNLYFKSGNQNKNIPI